MRTGPPAVRNPLETFKSRERRLRERWFEAYCPGDQPGIDIGCSDDPVHDSFDQWDMSFGDGDATVMAGIADETYVTVYASHLLEHISDPLRALQNWYRILKTGGHLIVCVPHRDLYEKRRLLPSRFNGDHKAFWLPTDFDPPNTFSLLATVKQAIPAGRVEMLRILDEGWFWLPPEQHSPGEYAIEIIVAKT